MSIDSPAGSWLSEKGIQEEAVVSRFSFHKDRNGGWKSTEYMYFVYNNNLYSIETMYPRDMKLIQSCSSEEESIEAISRRYFDMLSSGQFLMTPLWIYGERVNDDFDEYHLMFDGSGIDRLPHRVLKEIEDTLGEERGKLAQLIKTPSERVEDVVQGLDGWKKKSQDRQLEWKRYERDKQRKQEEKEDSKRMSRYLDEITSEDFWKERKEDEDEITN